VSINFTNSLTASTSSSPEVITVISVSFVAPKDKIPIKLLAFTFLPLDSILISDLKEEAFLTNNVAGLACKPVLLEILTFIDCIFQISFYKIIFPINNQ